MKKIPEIMQYTLWVEVKPTEEFLRLCKLLDKMGYSTSNSRLNSIFKQWPVENSNSHLYKGLFNSKYYLIIQYEKEDQEYCHAHSYFYGSFIFYQTPHYKRVWMINTIDDRRINPEKYAKSPSECYGLILKDPVFFTKKARLLLKERIA